MARYFSMVAPGIRENLAWVVDGDEAYRVGIPDVKTHPNCYFKLDPSDPLLESFEKSWLGWRAGTVLHEKPLAPGEYYARMARPIDNHPNDPGRFPTHSLYQTEIAGTVGQLVSLVGRLREICQSVQPEKANLPVYGHAIRECLMIAATEVESHWKAVLRANGVTGARLSTTDYIKTLAAMKLNEYELIFSHYPGIGVVAPFKWWEISAPTQTLAFYDAYNAVKHDRESAFARGTLEQAINGVGACAIMAVAQFGLTDVINRNRSLAEYFQVRSRPKWTPGELYTMDFDPWKAQPVHYPF
ncbi:MAG: hypothetical protein GC155_09825 [Alphaproteobacteria bacterium]|nr:hypothetical protein [Alphaproteobacteria bacterium]